MLKFGAKVKVNGHTAIVLESRANPMRYSCLLEGEAEAKWFYEYEVEPITEEKSVWENKGGAAFPIPDSGRFFPETGMSLRDYFAARVLPAIYTDVITSLTKSGFPSEDWQVGVAIDCYKMADAMLTARDID